MTKRDVHKKLRNSTYHKKALFNYLVSYGRPLNHILVDRIKDNFFNLNNFEEIPETKRLAPGIDKIKYAVCMAYNIEETALYVTRRGYFNEPRNVAVYLIRHLRNDTLKHVGEQFGIEKYSTVSSIVERVKYEMKADKELKNRIQNLAEKTTKSQRQT